MKTRFLALALVILSVFAYSQTQTTDSAKQDPKQQPVVDAPSAVKPAPTFPAGIKPATATAKPRPESEPKAADEVPAAGNTPAPMPQVQRKPGAKEDDDGREAFIIRTRVSFVTVPVTVKDKDGHLVDGLQRKDFAIYEDGQPQPLQLFTSDPYPLSAAVLIDAGMSDTAMKKINETLPAIAEAFSPYDEVSVYTYANSVQEVSNFHAANDELTVIMRRAKRSGRTGGVPVTSGPMAGSGPIVNGRPLDPGAPHVSTVTKESRTLNDAVLRAAQDLATRERGRRKIIFIISDGSESGSKASYSQVLKVLLQNEIIVYSIGVDASGIPVYGRLNELKAPFFGYGNILPKYVSATGGEHFSEFTRESIEKAYQRVTEVARNQYTLGYTTRATGATNYRQIEVRVRRPGLMVFAKDGYYPLPPAQNSPNMQPPATTPPPQ